MSFPYSPYGLPYPPMPTDQYGAPTGAAAPSVYATQYPAMPTTMAPQPLGPPVAAPPGGTGVTPGPALGPPIASYGPPGGTGQPAGYGPGGPADPSVFVHPGSGNRNQFGSGLAAYSPGPDVSDGGGGHAPPVASGVQVSSDVQTGPRTGAPLLPAAAGGDGAPDQLGPAVQKPPASVPNGATPVVGG